MLEVLAFILVSQAGLQKQTISPAKDSGNLPFTISVPQAWLKKGGVWPAPKDSEDGLVHNCGPKNTLTLFLSKSPSNSLASAVGSFAILKKKHPNNYFPLKFGVAQGCLVLVPIAHEKGPHGAPKDFLTGRIYFGDHRVLFFQYTIVDHVATAADRQLITSVIETVHPK